MTKIKFDNAKHESSNGESTFILHVFWEKRVCDFRESAAHRQATSLDFIISKKHVFHPQTEEKHPLGALMRLAFAGPSGSGGHYLQLSKSVMLYVFLNLTTVFLRKISNSISNEAPVRRDLLCSERTLVPPYQDLKSTNQGSNVTF